MNSSTEIQIDLYDGSRHRFKAGLNIDPIFKKNQATYALYNKPIINNNIVDENGSWMSLWNQTDIQGVSRNLHAAKNNEKIWSVSASDGGIRCTNKNVIEEAIYGEKNLSELENAITEELNEKAEKGGGELNPSFIEPLKSDKIVAKVKRLSNCEDSIHVDFGMWDIAQNNWFDNKYKVDFKVQDEYKNLISFKDFFGDEVRQDLLEKSNLVCKYGYEIALPSASADANAEKYRFMGWKTEKETDNFIDLSKRYKITEDTTFVAYFEEVKPKIFTVTYNGDSLGAYCFENWSHGDKEISKKYSEGAKIELLSPKDSEFRYGNSWFCFEYWTDKENKSYKAGDKVIVNSDLYYTAYYSEKSLPIPQLETCTIKYEMKEGFGSLKDAFFKNVSLADKTVDKGSSLSIPNPTKDVETIDGVKYTFEGWKLKGENGSLKDLPTHVSSDITLVAVFNKEDVPTEPTDPTKPEDPKPGTDPTNPEDPKPGTDPQPQPEQQPQPEPQPQPEQPGDSATPPVTPPENTPLTPPVFIEPLPIEDPVVIPENDTPLAEVIEEEETPLSTPIEDEEVILEDEEEPLAEAVTEDEEEPFTEAVTEDVEIEDSDTPLSEMPKTREVNYLSRLTLTAFAITGFAAILLLFGKIFKRR